MEQPSIQILGFTLQEPVTVLTDILVALVCIYAFYKIKNIPSNHPLKKPFMWYFLLSGIGTFIAAFLGHGLQYVVGHSGKLPGWIITMIAVFIFENISIGQAGFLFSSFWKKAIRYFIYLKLIISLPLVIYYQHFTIVQIFIGIGLLCIVGLINAIIYSKAKSESARWILIGIACLIGAAIIFAGKISISQWFNHHDIGHLFMGASAYCHYIAARKLIPNTSRNYYS